MRPTFNRALREKVKAKLAERGIYDLQAFLARKGNTLAMGTRQDMAEEFGEDFAKDDTQVFEIATNLYIGIIRAGMQRRDPETLPFG